MQGIGKHMNPGGARCENFPNRSTIPISSADIVVQQMQLHIAGSMRGRSPTRQDSAERPTRQDSAINNDLWRGQFGERPRGGRSRYYGPVESDLLTVMLTGIKMAVARRPYPPRESTRLRGGTRSSSRAPSSRYCSFLIFHRWNCQMIRL